jgi:hypothetical protein
MTPTGTAPPPPSTHELVHAVNNFLNVVVTTGQIALDERLDYTPERALESILASAEELTAFVRRVRGLETAPPWRDQPARSQVPPVAAGPLE